MSEAKTERAAAAALSIGAVVLGGLVVMLAAGAFDRPAIAQQSIKDNGYNAMTTAVVNRDVLFLIDDRNETLLTYDVQPSDGLRLLSVDRLPALFAAAKAQGGGARRR